MTVSTTSTTTFTTAATRTADSAALADSGDSAASGPTAAPAPATVRTVTDATFAAQVLRSDLPVLVEFTADWCPPCRQMAPVLTALATRTARIRPNP